MSSSENKSTLLNNQCSDKNAALALESDSAFHVTPINSAVVPEPSIQSNSFLHCIPAKLLDDASLFSQPISNTPKTIESSLGTSAQLPPTQISEYVNTFSASDESRYSLGMSDTISRCSLGKSPSERSIRSVRSLHATGTYPIGTLRVHSPSPTRSSATQTHEFLKCGDVIVMRGVDPGTLIGYDTVTLTIKKDQPFEGLKDVPMGVHLIWGSANKDSFRQGFWIISSNRAHLEYGEVIVKRWDKSCSVLDEEVSVAEMRIQQQSTPEFVQDLLSYNSDNTERVSSALEKRPAIWNELTSCIRGSLITKITGNEWNDWLVSSNQERKPRTRTNMVLHGDNSRGLSKDQVLNFTFPHSENKRYRNIASREKFSQTMDTSGHIQAITRVKCDDNDADEIIGELQFSYLTGICLKNSACIEHWAYIIKIVFQAFMIAVDEPIFFSKFIKAVHVQLIYDDGIEENSILDHEEYFRDDFKNILTVFKSRLTDLLLERGTNLTEDQKNVGKAFEDLESWLCRWNWDLRGNTDPESRDVEGDLDKAGSSSQAKVKKSSRSGLKLSVGWA